MLNSKSGAVSHVQPTGSLIHASGGPLRSRRLLSFLVPAVYLAAGYQFVHYYVCYPFFYLRLPEYFSGRERLPFQMRVLPILILRPLGRSHLVQRIAATRFGSLHNPYRIAFLALSLASLAIAWYYLVQIYNAVSRDRRFHFLLFPTFLFILLWTFVLHIEQDMSYPYDLPSLAFFTAGIFYIYRRRFLPLAFILFVGTLNRETTLFLIGIYILDAASIDVVTATATWRTRFNPAQIPWPRVALLGGIWLAAKLPLTYIFRFNDPSENIVRLHENFVRLITPWQWPAALNLGGYLLPFVLLFHARLRPARFANYLYILVPWAIIIFYTGIILETRVYGELCGCFAVAAVLLLEQYVEQSIATGGQTTSTAPVAEIEVLVPTSDSLAKSPVALHF